MAVIIDGNAAAKYTIVVIRVATFRSSQTRHPNTPSLCVSSDNWMTCQIIKCKLRLIHESNLSTSILLGQQEGKEKKKRKKKQKQKELIMCRI